MDIQSGVHYGSSIFRGFEVLLVCIFCIRILTSWVFKHTGIDASRESVIAGSENVNDDG